jgi:hypothetical protein
VLATGSDGYRVVYSLGELDPTVGKRADLVALQETIADKTSPLSSDGMAGVTAPGDAKGGRYVANRASLTLRASGSTVGGTGDGHSDRFSVTGAVVHGKTFDLAALRALPAVTEAVAGATWVGVRLWDLLNKVTGVVTDPAVKNDILNKYVVATGSEGFKTLIAMGEIDPDFGNQPDLIAYQGNGEFLDSCGFARLVIAGEPGAARGVTKLVNLQVFTAAPATNP